jgi:hypothetical protein
MLYIYPAWKVSIHDLVLGVCSGNSTDAVTRDREKYPNWRLPNCCTVLPVVLTTDPDRWEHAVTLIFFEHVGYWKMCHSIHVFTCGFSFMVLHYITIMKCLSDCLKMMLDVGEVTVVKLQFSGLHTHLTSALKNFFCWNI